jgi:GcrA cell cycle regulator
MDDEVKQMFAVGHSAREIGNALGVSRNAVIGRAHRQGVRSIKSPRVARSEGGTKSLELRRKARTQAAVNGHAVRRINAPAPPPPEKWKDRQDFKDAPATKCSLLELTTHKCRWPFGDPRAKDFAFCGAHTVADQPYCAEHCSVAYGGRP